MEDHHFQCGRVGPGRRIRQPLSGRGIQLYSTADDYVFNIEIQFPADVTHVAVAEAILESMPSLQRTTPEQTGNQEYASWYAQLISQVHNVRDLPVAYADYFDDSKGWELGWGTKHFFPRPPDYVPAPAVQQPDPHSDGPHRDEIYVLGLCEQVLKADCVRQKTFLGFFVIRRKRRACRKNYLSLVIGKCIIWSSNPTRSNIRNRSHFLIQKSLQQECFAELKESSTMPVRHRRSPRTVLIWSSSIIAILIITRGKS